MYTRQITEPPKKIIINGKPIFGTFSGTISKLDIKGVRKPFGVVPLPTFITNFTIRSQLSLVFRAGNYIGQIAFFDAKLFGYVEVVFWDTDTNTKSAYKTFTGPRKRLIPKNLSKGICASFKKNRYVKISWDRKSDRFSILFNLASDSSRPEANAAFRAKSSQSVDLVSVMPAPTLRRCSATWICSVPINGMLSVGSSDNKRIMNNADGSALLSMNRSYYKLHVKFDTVTGVGTYNDKKLQFRIMNNSFDASDTNNCNSNVLILDNEITPLPQVFITHPFGITKTWIIQDTENMVDLTFKPISENLTKMNTIVFRTVYHSIYGTFEGTLMTKDGKSITLKSFPGIVRAVLLRL